MLQSGKFFHYSLIIFGVEVTKMAAMMLNSLSFDHINWKTSRRWLTENSAAETKILHIEFLTQGAWKGKQPLKGTALPNETLFNHSYKGNMLLNID